MCIRDSDIRDQIIGGGRLGSAECDDVLVGTGLFVGGDIKARGVIHNRKVRNPGVPGFQQFVTRVDRDSILGRIRFVRLNVGGECCIEQLQIGRGGHFRGWF